MNQSKTLKAIVFIVAVIICIGVVYNTNKNFPHGCEYDLCPFKGQTKFVDDICGCPVGGDCWALDQIHFDYPHWTYDECEKELFGSVRIKN